jgi:GNAT superfamily N-acetyltransferase
MPNMGFSVEGPYLGQAAVCEPILRSLPAWFGIEQAIVHYVTEIDRLPTFLATGSGGVVGFVSVKQHFPSSAELYVIAVRQQVHRQGVGRVLVDRAKDWLRGQAIEYLQVKTLGPSHGDPGYANTRAFYAAMGFRPLEELADLWDERNPCLIMVQRL